MEFAHSPSNLPSGAKPASSLGRRRSGELQISNRPAAGKPCAPAPARCPASLGEAAETDHCRSTLVGLAVPSLGCLALVLAHPQAGNSHWLAPQGFSCVLDLESSPWATWKTQRSEGCAQTHS